MNTTQPASSIAPEPVDGQLLSECNDVDFLRAQVGHLYQVLDDISSGSDTFKPCDSNEGGYKAFYEFAIRLQAKKNHNLASDGYKLHCIA
jgi:hypothetical protein